MLHQHRTGRKYYVSLDAEEESAATMQAWNQVTQSPLPSISCPPSPLPFSSFVPFPSTRLTPTQCGYVPHEGDWQCVHCHNVNFARHTECKRCARKKNE